MITVLHDNELSEIRSWSRSKSKPRCWSRSRSRSIFRYISRYGSKPWAGSGPCF